MRPPRIAIIEFPGLNCELETRRAVQDAGMEGIFVRWNDDTIKLNDFDGIIIGGGFSYEDRVRAGLIASMDPRMQEVRTSADAGKPVLGICNGAQILMESGLIPGVNGHELAMCLARNKRMDREGNVLGVGFYNTWVHLKAAAPEGRSAFTIGIDQNSIHEAPVAHGEGRFTTDLTDLLPALQKNNQILFQYCTEDGDVLNEFPVNPNGALANMAAICNPAGTVCGIMPHPERAVSATMPQIFSSMQQYLTGTKLKSVAENLSLPITAPQIQKRLLTTNTLEFLVDLIITDNEAETLQFALRRLGYQDLTIRRRVSFSVETKGVAPADLQKFAATLIQSGELLNTNKELVTVGVNGEWFAYHAIKKNFSSTSLAPVTQRILVKDREDFVGLSKTAALRRHVNAAQIVKVDRGTLWELNGSDTSRITKTAILFNPHAQEAYSY